jgi:isopentenyldiphosphate isomerase
VFPDLEVKCDEKYPVIGANFAIGIERSASSLFGITCRGVHMTVYTLIPEGMKFWIPRRNLNKVAFPGKLDNAVAGGIAIGEDPIYSLVREAEEETGLSEDFVKANVKAAGNIS